MIRHCLTVLDVAALMCSGRSTQFVGVCFCTMCKHMGVRHAKTMAYPSCLHGRADVASRRLFEKLLQFHIEEPERDWYLSLCRVLQVCHDLPGPYGLSSDRILFLRD